MSVPRCTLQISFLSTPSGWRATAAAVHHSIHGLSISIHALRVEGDPTWRPAFIRIGQTFLSTPSGWRATRSALELVWVWGFLSTPSGWRATLFLTELRMTSKYFYPRPPGGGRPLLPRVRHICQRNFYPRPPGGGRQMTLENLYQLLNFYPRPPGGGRQERRAQNGKREDFYPRPLGGGRRAVR